MNESIFRSPKWLRNFVDFEVNTGSDIKGEPSRRQKLKEWDNIWSKISSDTFKDFFKDVYSTEFKNDYNGYLSERDLDRIRDKYRGDMSIWEKYNKWVILQEDIRRKQEDIRRKHEEDIRRKKQEKEREQDKLRKEINDIYNTLYDDFRRNPYSDKINTEIINGSVQFTYKFENGKIFKMKDNRMEYNGYIYTLGMAHKNQYVTLINEMIKSCRRRSTNQQSNTSNPYASHPKGGMYQTLKDTIKLRKEQLSKLSKNDPERSALENELTASERAFDNLKKKYKFEHLTNYNSYSFIR